MRKRMVLLTLLLGAVIPAMAQVNIGFGYSAPGVSIGINLPMYPELAPIPGYPVYYAPRLDSNYFFYDGMYWVYEDDDWYASSWYNGPWDLIEPEVVPLYVLRIPVRYYRQAPVYFRNWQRDAPPRWGEYWGYEWAQRRDGWDRWNRHAVPARLPPPVYQRQFSGNRYPHPEQQRVLENRHYRFTPRDPLVRQQHEGRGQPDRREPVKSGPDRYPDAAPHPGQPHSPNPPRTQHPQKEWPPVQQPGRPPRPKEIPQSPPPHREAQPVQLPGKSRAVHPYPIHVNRFLTRKNVMRNLYASGEIIA